MSSCFIPNEVPAVVMDAIAREMAEPPLADYLHPEDLSGPSAQELGHETTSWQVFTDGASSPDGRGGWAYVVVKDDIEIRRGQGSALGVTHQRMEIRAVAEALLAFPLDVPVKVIGDSAYAIDCFVNEWHVKWVSNGWRNYSKKPVANRDEWERALAALQARSARTSWKRVPGHDKGKHPWNDLADRLAVEAKGLLLRPTPRPS